MVRVGSTVIEKFLVAWTFAESQTETSKEHALAAVVGAPDHLPLLLKVSPGGGQVAVLDVDQFV